MPEEPGEKPVQSEVDLEIPAKPEPAESAAKPHPLEPGGERFNEVYRRMKAAEDEAREARDRVSRLEGQVQATQQQIPSVAPTFYTPDQLQAACDRGQITPAQMTQQLAWQESQRASAQVLQYTALQQKVQAALVEVNQYMDKMPMLANTSSPEFRKVSVAAAEISDEMGLPVSDPRVQRRALRESFGTLERITQRNQIQDGDRASRRPHSESGRGGGETPSPPASADVLKGIPQSWIDYRKSKGYSQKMIEDEAKFYRKRE